MVSQVFLMAGSWLMAASVSTFEPSRMVTDDWGLAPDVFSMLGAGLGVASVVAFLPLLMVAERLLKYWISFK